MEEELEEVRRIKENTIKEYGSVSILLCQMILKFLTLMIKLATKLKYILKKIQRLVFYFYCNIT